MKPYNFYVTNQKQVSIPRIIHENPDTSAFHLTLGEYGLLMVKGSFLDRLQNAGYTGILLGQPLDSNWGWEAFYDVGSGDPVPGWRGWWATIPDKIEHAITEIQAAKEFLASRIKVEVTPL